MISYIFSTPGSSCYYLRTGGYADVSGDNDNWSWNMTTFSKPATKTHWKNTEPNNNHDNKIEDMIMVIVNEEMEWADGKQEIEFNQNKLNCYICEYSV